MSMQTLTWDVDAAAVAGNSDAYSLALAMQARQKLTQMHSLNKVQISYLLIKCKFSSVTHLKGKSSPELP